MKVLVVAEFYPRVADPALGIWAHRQALAARDHGADVRVVVLHRPIAPAARFREPDAWRAALSQPGHQQLDGLDVRYLKFVSPPRGRSYAHWSAVARERDWRIGVVDATPIGHTIRPAAEGYPRETAAAEARRFLDGRPYVARDDVRTLAKHRVSER